MSAESEINTLIFLVEGVVIKRPYMQEETRQKETRIVYARTSEEAEEKFKKFFEGQSEDYDVSYRVWDCAAHQPIL